MRFEGKAKGSQQGEGEAPRQGNGLAGKMRRRGEEIGQHKQNKDMVALAEIAGKWMHPVRQLTVRQLADAIR